MKARREEVISKIRDDEFRRAGLCPGKRAELHSAIEEWIFESAFDDTDLCDEMQCGWYDQSCRECHGTPKECAWV